MKTILITGSTDGIGKLAAIKLAKDGHKVFLHGRNGEKLQNVIKEVRTAANNEHVDGFVADLSDLSAVEAMAEQVVDKLDSLDVLVNNAGIFKSPVERTQDGFDIRFAVNYFAPKLLTEALLPLLKKASGVGKARVINLSSAAQSPVSLSALAGEQPTQAQSAYAQSKLALTMWNTAFAHENSDITAIAVNPGSLLNTNMVKEAYGQHWSSADKGAEVLYQLSTAEQFVDDSGKYFDNDLSPKQGTELGDFSQAHPDAYNQAKIDALLDATNKIMSSLT